MCMFESMVDVGVHLYDLARDQSQWSQATFGHDNERSPMGALKHLAKEAVEAQDAIGDPVKFAEECADCFLLILDAARRGGIKPLELIIHAQNKMEVNKTRAWPAPTSDEPVEHIR